MGDMMAVETESSPITAAMAWFHRADAAEHRLCLRLNGACRVPGIRRLFSIISRLGNGVFWYTLLVFLPVAYGEAGLYPALRMALVGVVGLALYKYLKSRLTRERPYITLAGVIAGTPALDRYSFPSGHTLHAASFTVLACVSFPELSWLCVPFAALVAASRVVLGLHYPTDVLAGAGIGAGLAVASIKLLPL
jgi:undecaprenyl-diphosphatase